MAGATGWSGRWTNWRRGAEAVVHCGDIGDAACLKALAHGGQAVYAVSGNTDRNVAQLAQAAAEAGIEFHWEVVEVPLSDGRFLVATHGHDRELVNGLLLGRQFPYVCLGHSHQPRDERFGPVRLINPGALHRAVKYTVALLDTATDDLG